MAANPVNSVNMVGYANVGVPSNGWVMLSLNWNSIGGNASIPINSLISGNGLKSGLDFGTADKLFVWDATLNAGTGGYKTYYLYIDNLWYEYLNDNAPTTNVITRGGGLWMKHEAAATNVTLSGEVPLTTTNVVTFGVGLWSMVGSAYTYDMLINGTNQIWSGNKGLDFGTSDQLYVWNSSLNSGTGGYKTYYLYIDGFWYEYLNDNAPTTDKIPLGGGAWFKNNGVSPSVWTEIKPY